jgi:hypothetical protein
MAVMMTARMVARSEFDQQIVLEAHDDNEHD